MGALYMVDPSTPTGVCATLITGIERSLCTNLNAANNYKVEHCKEAAHWEVVKAANIVYSAGFFATVSQELEAHYGHHARLRSHDCLRQRASHRVPCRGAAEREARRHQRG